MSALSLEFAVVLLRYVCVLITVLFVGLRWNRLQRGLDPNDASLSGRVAWVALLSIVAIIDDHTAWTVEVSSGRFVPRQLGVALGSDQAIIDLRDLITCLAGLAGGLRTGLAVGVIAGVNRWWIGGEYAQAASLATLGIGFISAWIHQRFPHAYQKPGWALLIGLFITLVQRLVIVVDFVVLEQRGIQELVPLFTAITLPKAVTNMVGCALFAWIMQVAATDRRARMHELTLQERDRELSRHLISSYLGQAEPHFLYNTLNNIRGVYVRDGLDQGDAALVRLAEFFRSTHAFTERTLIALHKELDHVRAYVALRQLGFGNRLQFSTDIDPGLVDVLIPPHALLTLAENSVKYALQDGKVLEMHLVAIADSTYAYLTFSDNGGGYAKHLLERLGHEWIASQGVGTGTALYALTRTLRLLHGEASTLRFNNGSNGGALTMLRIPLRTTS